MLLPKLALARKAKTNITDDQVAAGTHRGRDKQGNDHADSLADLGVEGHGEGVNFSRREAIVFV